MDKPSEQPLSPAHRRLKGEKRDSKEYGDDDIGVQNYDAGGRRQQLNGLWDYSTITGGSIQERIICGDYCKDDPRGNGEKKEKGKIDLIDEIGAHGPPLQSGSLPKRIF